MRLVGPTADEAKLISLAAGSVPTEKELVDVLNAIQFSDRATPGNVPGALGWVDPTLFQSHCARWGSSFENCFAGQPIIANSDIRMQAYALRYPAPGGPEHHVVLIDINHSGVIMCVDNGFFGGQDRIFTATNPLHGRYPEETKCDLREAIRDFKKRGKPTPLQ